MAETNTMSRTARTSFRIALLLACALAAPALAQTSTYSSMAISGNFNNNSATPNMTLVETNTWRGTVFLYTHTNSFQFVANGSWASGHYWGETNQATFVPPFTSTAEKNPGTTRKILLTNSPRTSCVITFNDSTREYTVEPAPYLPSNIVAVAGDFNSWSATPNMEMMPDGTWQGDFYINAPNGRFKFVYNNWTVEIGDTNQVGYILPISGTAEVVSYGSDIVYSNAVTGFYRFRLDNDSLAYSMRLLYSDASGVNLIKNPSFEVAGSWSERARNWEWGVPDTHGNYWQEGQWSRAKRQNYARHRSGGWLGTLAAKWSPGDDDFGGWWQEGAALPGYTYQASAWFWSDPEWVGGNHEMKIEFYNADRSTMLDVATTYYMATNTHWTRNTVRAVAPPDTAWARIVIAMSGAGTQGAMQFDDVELRRLATRTQDFESWGAFTTDGCHEWDDWAVCTGKAVDVFVSGGVTQDLARGIYAISVANPTASTNDGGYFLSPYFEEGIGTIRFWYRNGFTGNEDDMGPARSVALRLQVSPNAVTWQTLEEITNIQTMAYTEYARFFYIQTSMYVRILHAGGSTNRLLLDDISIAQPERTTRFMDFNAWPDDGTNLGSHMFFDWIVQTGRIWTVNAMEGKSAFLPGSTTTPNFVRSPYIPSGYGTISFYYARGTNGTGPATLRLETSPDGIYWTPIDTVSNITSTSFLRYEQFFYNPDGAYLRINNLTNATAAATPLILDEEFFGGITPPSGWTFVSISSIYTTSGNYGRNPPSIRFDATGDQIVTPLISNPTNLSFWTKGQSIDPTSALHVEGFSGGGWVTITNMTGIPNTGRTNRMTVSTSVNRIRFTYTKVAGNLSFDDVIITGVPTVPDTTPQAVLLDQINLAGPVMSRYQDFDSWSRESSYGTYVKDGWTVVNAIIESAGAYAGLAPRMRDGSDERSITSPFFRDGLGPVSLRYRHWNGSAPAVVYRLQTSTNGATWTDIDTITITSVTYQTYSRYLTITNGVYARLFWISGNQRVYFDEIDFQPPGPPPNVLVSAWTDPAAPYKYDAVAIMAYASPLYGAENLAVTSYYRVGTSGAFTAFSMSQSDYVFYESASMIPNQPTGTIVQYYVRVDFGGSGSDATSPVFYPPGGSNAPAWYGIPRNQPGKVWINEINYVNNFFAGLDTNEFVELAGPAGMDIGGWRIYLVNGSQDVTWAFSGYADYTIPSPFVLSDAIAGYGFFTLGDTQYLSIADMFFTNLASSIPEDNLANGNPDGIRVVNEMGGIEIALSYKGRMEDFSRISQDQSWLTIGSVSLMGAGSNYSDFAWVLTNHTPGAVNEGQTLIPMDPPPPPSPPDDIDIMWISRGTNVQLFTYGNTNVPAWHATPYWTTNLRASPQQWQQVTPYSSEFQGRGTNRVWFTAPTNAFYFYRVVLTPPD